MSKKLALILGCTLLGSSLSSSMLRLFRPRRASAGARLPDVMLVRGLRRPRLHTVAAPATCVRNGTPYVVAPPCVCTARGGCAARMSVRLSPGPLWSLLPLLS